MPVLAHRRAGMVGPVSMIRINESSGVPVFQQIVEQVTYMIETGQLDDGDQLPSSRMLADNLP